MKPTTRSTRSIRRALGLSAVVLAVAGAPVSGMAAILCNATPLSVPANVDGVYLNLVTGATGTSGAATAGWDINLYMTGANALYFFWPQNPANSSGGASTATVYDALAAGATIGPAQTYILNSGGGGPAPFVNWQTTQTGKYLGARFYNEGTSAINYAWLQLDTGASGGFPAKINKYCYDNTGAAIPAGNEGLVTPSLVVATSGNPSEAGTNVTFTSTLSGNSALTGAGTITFCADAPTTNATCGGATPLCTVPATVVSATCSTSGLAVGTHAITAYFSGDANNLAATSPPLSQVVTAPPPPVLALQNDLDFAPYGQVVDYVVTLTNNADSTANAISVTFTLSSGFDVDAAQWNCSGAGATCVQDPGDPLHYTVTLPAHGSVTWQVGVPVREDATEDDVTFTVEATGAMPVSDVATLVIFRDGFDADPDASAPAPLLDDAQAGAVLDGDALQAVDVPQALTMRPEPLLIVRDGAREVRVEGRALGDGTYVRLLVRGATGSERASAWSVAKPGAALGLGSEAREAATADSPRVLVLLGAQPSIAL